MIRSELTPMPVYFDRYINKNDDVDVITAIHKSIHELENAPLSQWVQIDDKVYAPGKWTIKDILQHMIDTERIFSYRATAFPEVMPMLNLMMKICMLKPHRHNTAAFLH
ncbi:MAG: hypothetical protein IPL12_16085 [Bacteroidetes bacterium]|nr:hypothetical protein [Bacteroidota bacterium]